MVRAVLRRSTTARRIVLIALALTLVWPLGASVSAGVGAAQPITSAGHRYVALGDSRASGPTFTSFSPDGCFRSSTGYPILLARSLRVTTFTDVACSGATTADILDHAQRPPFPLAGAVPAQVSALRADTSLVTLSIGGNDVGWGGLLDRCLSVIPGGDRRCRDDASLRATMSARFARLAPAVDRVLAAIHDRAPAAQVIVVGHGGYYGTRGCYPDASASDADIAFIRGFFADFDAALAGPARRAGDTFVDVRSAAAGHDSCAPSGRRWFTGEFPRDNAFPNHPTPAGSAAMARLVQAAVR